MKRLLLTFYILATVIVVTAYAGRTGWVRLRFRMDGFLAMNASQIEKRKEMTAEIYDWEHPNRLHFWDGVPNPTKLEFGEVTDAGWQVCTQTPGGGWINDTNWPATTNMTEQWWCYLVSNQQTDGIGGFAWAQKWRSSFTGLNPKFKIDLIDE